MPRFHNTAPLRSRRAAAVAVLLLTVAGVALWYFTRDGKSEDEALRTAPVVVGTVESIVTAQGKLEPKEYVDVGTQVSGLVKKLHVAIGDNVKKGDLLAEIDPRIYESRVEADLAQLNALKAQLAEQQASLELAQQQHARSEKLIATNAVSRDVHEQSAAALKTANARVKTQMAQITQAESTLKGDRTNLEFTRIFAPMHGTVVTLPAREGMTVNASQTAPTLMQLANLDVMTVRAQVAEADVPKVKEGMEVRFTTLGAMEKRWQASVRQVLPTPQVTNDVVLYDVLIDADNASRELMNGMSTQVFFELGRAADVLTIPTEALGRRVAEEDSEAGAAYMVRVQKGGAAQERLVHVGLTDRMHVEIKDGLKDGERVVLPTRKAPAEGQRQGRGGGGGGFGGGPRL